MVQSDIFHVTNGIYRMGRPIITIFSAYFLKVFILTKCRKIAQNDKVSVTNNKTFSNTGKRYTELNSDF